MTGPDLLIDGCDGWLRLTLNRPDKLNALTRELIAALTQALRECADDPDIRAVLLTGAGRGFCSGQDLGRRDPDGDDWPPDLEASIGESYSPLVATLMTLPKPVVCAVNGVAAGAGANLALAADVVIATESAFFLQAFTRIGLMPDAGGTFWLPRQMGAAKAMGAALFAEPISARQADRWGMIWEAVEDDGFENRWRARARHLAQGPTVAYRNLKRAIRDSWENALDAQLDLEARLQGECGTSRDFKEGVVAFQDKREARFEGR